MQGRGAKLDTEADIQPGAEPPAPRERVGGYELVRRILAPAEMEVWRAIGPDGAVARLKRATDYASPRVRAAFRQEADLLQMLEVSGMPWTPRVLDADLEAPSPWIALSWCEGVDLQAWMRDPARPLERRARVAERLAGLYVELHERGVLHGDAHPRNALVDDADRVWLVDFGAARLADAPVPPAGEQDAVATMAYGVVAGQLAAPPRSFAERDLGWPALERVLARALASNPADRWPNLAAFARALSHTVAVGPPS